MREGEEWRASVPGRAGHRARYRLAEKGTGHPLALATARGDAQRLAKLVERLDPEVRALADLAVGHCIADADVHRSAGRITVSMGTILIATRAKRKIPLAEFRGTLRKLMRSLDISQSDGRLTLFLRIIIVRNYA
jgi:hypothetical protein